MKKFILTLAVMLLANGAFANEAKNLSADEALCKLKQGNANFVKMHLEHPNVTKARRAELKKGQKPFAVVITCSDSRVPAEIVFDQGLGDIFVIRNAGNVLDEHVVGSIEYAVEHLGTNLVVVMGHECCGAVGATMSNAKASENIESIKKSIQPALEQAKKENKLSAECVEKNNAKLGATNALKSSEVLREAVEKCGLKVVPAYYDLDTGMVEFMN